MKFCTNCGLRVSSEVSFCPRCGAYIPPASASSDSLPPVSPAASTTPDPVNHNAEMQPGQEDFGPIQESMPTVNDFSSEPLQGQRLGGFQQTGHGFEMYPSVPEPKGQSVGQSAQTASLSQASASGTYPQYDQQFHQYTPGSPQQQVVLPPPPPTPLPVSLAQATPSAPTYPSYSPPASPLPRATPPPPRPRKGMSGGMIVLCAALAVIVLLGGVGLIVYAAVIHPAQLHAQATATVQAVQTSNANATAIANTQATGTAIANANATATAQTQATAQAQATVTALQAIYTQAIQGTPVLSSSLAGQDGFNWDEYQTTDGGGCAFTGGALHATLYSQHFYVPCFAQASNFSNFAFQVQMTINKGDEGGLVFRADDQNAKFYLFTVGHDGTYALYLSKDNNHNMSIAYGNSSAINKNYGQSNLVTVIAKGSSIYLYINKQYVSSVTDSTYASGKVGIFASDNTNNTDVSFSNAEVWKL
ncbi:MAG TPA: hypothetical protein DHW02_18120 [Ktedonobacter sp.]|nr:hypothetical protein [Ktedonobacter sp.]